MPSCHQQTKSCIRSIIMLNPYVSFTYKTLHAIFVMVPFLVFVEVTYSFENIFEADKIKITNLNEWETETQGQEAREKCEIKMLQRKAFSYFNIFSFHFYAHVHGAYLNSSGWQSGMPSNWNKPFCRYILKHTPRVWNDEITETPFELIIKFIKFIMNMNDSLKQKSGILNQNEHHPSTLNLVLMALSLTNFFWLSQYFHDIFVRPVV